ncbi:MAG: hypothetical protein HUJ57_01600 [Erysipelotrichaceae bacterium]|nr:hypothetical protein [Erysipelotrichaceae bacterium]
MDWLFGKKKEDPKKKEKASAYVKKPKKDDEDICLACGRMYSTKLDCCPYCDTPFGFGDEDDY